MANLTDKLRKAGILNTVLIVLTMLCEAAGLLVMSAFSSDRILNIANIIALLCGIFYVFTGYRKGRAQFFKLFMIIYAFVSAYDVIADIAYCISAKITILCIIEILANVLAALCVIILAFTSNFGKKASMRLGKINCYLTVVSDLVFGIFIYKDILVYADIYFGDMLLSCLALLFITAKYVNKQTRGAK